MIHYFTTRHYTTTRRLLYHRRSQMFVPTLREDPADATVPSHRLLLRAGFIRQMDHTAGLYMTLPMGLRVLDKIERLVDMAMARCGGNKLAMPLLLPSSLWKRTGRWDTAGEELIRVQDRRGADYCLAPTHEEAFTELVASAVASWRQLDDGGLRLYQTGNKYRDEVRPRFGLMRSREFVMKDMYSFDADEEAAKRAYNEVSTSYSALCHAVFGSEGQGWSRVEADTGNIGGSLSHEYQVHADVGEDLLLHCSVCHHSANQEKMATIDITDNTTTSSEVNQTHVWYGIDQEGRPLCIHIGGIPAKREVNPLKVQAILGLREEPTQNITTDDNDNDNDNDNNNDDQGKVVQLVHGNRMEDRTDNNYPIDIIQAEPNDTCPACLSSSCLTGTRGIEIGHVFYLGDKYSKAMKATYQDKNGREALIDMGCYGIGISRIAAAAVERLGGHDSDGIVWPEAIAPYRIAVVPIGGGGGKKGLVAREFLQQKAASLCLSLEKNGVVDADDVVLDDRTRESPGVRLKEASLMGFPWLIVLGKTCLPAKDSGEWEDREALERFITNNDEEQNGSMKQQGTVEIQERATGESVHLPYGNVVEYLKNHPRCQGADILLEEGFALQNTCNKK